MYHRISALGVNGGFLAMTTLFFAWGFISANNDPLIVALRAAYGLNYTEALLIQIVFFITSGLIALPAAALVERVGPMASITVSLALMAVGCLAVAFVVRLEAYALILCALFVLAAGITSLQVAANPLAAALGPSEASHFRLNLAQALNSIGVVIGVHFGSFAMLSPDADPQHHGETATMLAGVSRAYLFLALALTVLLAFIFSLRRSIGRQLPKGGEGPSASILTAFRSPWVLAGALAIGLYVGAEVAIGSIMINFLHQAETMNLPFETGGRYLANFYWGGALVGRIVGSLLLIRFSAARLLANCAFCATALCLTVFMTTGPIAGMAALSVGLFNSIMFPTIFSLTLQRAKVPSSGASGILCLAITGGAFMPFLVGRVADEFSLSAAFVIPAVAYAIILIFGLISQHDRKPIFASADRSL